MPMPIPMPSPLGKGGPSSESQSQSVSQYQLQAKRNTKFAQIFIALFPEASCLPVPSPRLSSADWSCANCLVAD